MIEKKIKPVEERLRIRDEKIRALHRAGYSMNDICISEGHSKTTVFFAIKGRKSKRAGGLTKKI